MTTDLVELVYVSAARRPFLAPELTELLTKARVRNGPRGISGMLLYSEGAFLQVLEGPAEVVTRAFDHIELDRRHHRVLRLFAGPIEQRTFGEWSMGFVDSHDPKVIGLPGFTDFLKSGIVKTLAETDSERVRNMAQQFRKGRWRQAIVPSVR